MVNRNLLRNASCWNCKNAKIFNGTWGTRLTPPESAEAECQIKEITEKTWNFIEFITDNTPCNYEEIAPLHCGYYSPHIIEKCDYCKNKMVNTIKHLWPFVISEFWSGELIYCCSFNCFENQKKIEEGKREKYENEIKY